MAPLDLLAQLKQEIAAANGLLLEAIAELTEEQVRARPGGTLPSIAFQVWHSARWADHDNAAYYGGDREIWFADGFAERWGLIGLEASDSETGTGLADEQAASLALPGKQELLSYASAAFVAMESSVAKLAATQLTVAAEPPESTGGTIQALLFTHLSHVNRHLGMIEAIKGLQGLNGSATR